MGFIYDREWLGYFFELFKMEYRNLVIIYWKLVIFKVMKFFVFLWDFY